MLLIEVVLLFRVAIDLVIFSFDTERFWFCIGRIRSFELAVPIRLRVARLVVLVELVVELTLLDLFILVVVFELGALTSPISLDSCNRIGLSTRILFGGLVS